MAKAKLDVAQLMQEPEVAEAVTTMSNKELVLRRRVSNTVIEVRARIVLIEPFKELLEGTRYMTNFDAQERSNGEAFTFYAQGHALSTVHDETRRSILVLKKFKVIDAETGDPAGNIKTFGGLLMDEEGGLGLEKGDEVNGYRKALDGVEPGPNADIDFVDVGNKAAKFGAAFEPSKNENSWAFVKAKS